MVAQRDDWISLEDYLALDHESLDQKYEYIDGRMYALAGGSTSHSIIASNTIVTLAAHLDETSCVVFTSDMIVQISENACLFPDASVSCDPKDTQEIKNTIQSPRLIIEVLSPTTEKDDRGRKFLLYQQCKSIQEYVLISQDKQLVEIFTRDINTWIYRIYRRDENVEFKSLNIKFPIKKLYKNVVLPTEKDIPQQF